MHLHVKVYRNIRYRYDECTMSKKTLVELLILEHGRMMTFLNCCAVLLKIYQHNLACVLHCLFYMQ